MDRWLATEEWDVQLKYENEGFGWESLCSDALIPAVVATCQVITVMT